MRFHRDDDKTWVTRFADEERLRSERVAHDRSPIVHSADVAQFRMQTLLDSLRDHVEHDVDAFAREFPKRFVHFENTPVSGGFAVRREHYPEVHLSVIPDSRTGSLHVDYLFASGGGIAAPKPLELVFGEGDVKGWHFSGEDGHPVRSVTELSEYLLVPVFRGCPCHLGSAHGAAPKPSAA